MNILWTPNQASTYFLLVRRFQLPAVIGPRSTIHGKFLSTSVKIINTVCALIQTPSHERLLEQVNPRIARSIGVLGEADAGTLGGFMQLIVDGQSGEALSLIRQIPWT